MFIRRRRNSPPSSFSDTAGDSITRCSRSNYFQNFESASTGADKLHFDDVVDLKLANETAQKLFLGAMIEPYTRSRIDADLSILCRDEWLPSGGGGD